MRQRRILRTLAAATVVLGVIVGATVASQAAPPSNDPNLAADFGARWAAGQVNAQGFVENPDASANVSATIDTALALGAAKVDSATFAQIVDWLEANTEAAINSFGSDNPGAIGSLLMVVHLAGLDANDFGAAHVDLVARLGSTLGLFAAGLYGAKDPSFDGSYRQSLGILGLAAVGASVPTAARDWLLDQQCTTPTAAVGGWQAYRADLALPCDPPDPIMFTGADTNSTAIAVQALDAIGVTAPEAAALDFLEAAQTTDGGFGFVAGADPDPNSTALVIGAIIAGGEDPQSGRWVLAGGDDPITSLLTWQLGCGADAADRGAFASPFSSGAPDGIATRQAVWGASLQALPFPSGSFSNAAVPCAPVVVTTTIPSNPSNPSTSTTSTTSNVNVLPSSSNTNAVVATPRFTG